MDQDIIDRAVNIATHRTLNGYPVLRIIWIPPAVTGDSGGSFCVQDCPPLGASDTPPWDR